MALAFLRHLSDAFKEGDQLCHSLGQKNDTSISMTSDTQGGLYNNASYREAIQEFYANGLSYQDVKKLKITSQGTSTLMEGYATRRCYLGFISNFPIVSHIDP